MRCSCSSTNFTQTLAPITMRHLYAILIWLSLVGCSEHSDAETSEIDTSNNFGIQQGDSIPLQEALDMFDSQFTGNDLSENGPKVELQTTLDSLKEALLLDPQNSFLKSTIEEIESDLALFNFVEEDIARRDSMINALVTGIDSLIKNEKPK